ncbi:hypothetical protein MHN00_11820 [Alteromonas sp. Cnat2-8]|uniref:hypothetical protein n=1 Tax=Alteromonas sp. Cnat2-8 TaxID=2917728 RepID=UPI001EF5112B|nr:hypothetical protein [Alteromonas sp. Cnat2-8]MCG7654244.1 hypothetical protein [Alteromonas sp. Cnat2-8]
MDNLKPLMSNSKQWEEHREFIKSRTQEKWVGDAKNALDWFLEVMGEDEWAKRKKAVVAYFKKQQESIFPENGKPQKYLSENEKAVAFHQDWTAWYLYLVESLFYRPYVSQPSQSCRIFPFFSAIGRHIDLIKNISGVDDKLHELLRGKINQPDAVLFEISVALMYARNGWKVSFITETPPEKSPDLLIEKGNISFYVECKRQSKVTEYSEKERNEWLKRWDKLVPAMTAYNTPTHMDILFKVEVSETNELVLVSAFNELVKNNMIDSGHFLENDQIKVSVKNIDMSSVDQHFDKYQVLWNSPQMISLFAGGYESNGNYTQIHSPKGINIVGPDDDEHVLNLYCSGVHSAYCAKWECISDISIDKKAKDVRKLLSKAIKQAPANGDTIIHIAYETLEGPQVEIERHKKIANSINTFNYGEKNVSAVYCHALQPSTGVEDSEWAETTIRFGRNGTDPTKILPHDLLLDEENTAISDDTHWLQDLLASLK